MLGHRQQGLYAVFLTIKPWISNNIKVLLNQKKQAFKEDREKMKHVQQEEEQAKLGKQKESREEAAALLYQRGLESHEYYWL